MSSFRFLLFAGLLLAVGLPVGAPNATAHEDGCLVVVHQGFLTTHQGCTSTAHTCFSNVEARSTEYHLACKDPEAHPCLFRVKVLGPQVKACP